MAYWILNEKSFEERNCVVNTPHFRGQLRALHTIIPSYIYTPISQQEILWYILLSDEGKFGTKIGATCEASKPL